MAKIEKLDDHRKGDRLTAHLAMAAAEESEPAGGCLTSEQLADVAAGCCTAEERKAALAHFASCRKCYDAWVAVSFSLVAMESGLERRKRPLFSLRNLGYLGSAFAVAASVVLFLQIRQTPQETVVMPPAERSTESVRQPAPVQQKAEQLLREKAASEPPAPPAAASNRGEAPASAPAPATTTMGGGQDLEKRIAPRAPVAEKKATAAALADRAADSAEQKARLSAADWLTRLEQSCREQSYQRDPEGWSRLLAEGKEAEESGAEPRIREQLRAVQIVLATENEPGGAEAQCRRILQLLAEGGKSE